MLKSSRLIDDLREFWQAAQLPAFDFESCFGSSGPDSPETTQFFSTSMPKEVQAKDLRAYAEALTCFTPEAFRAFLPLFLLVTTEDPEGADALNDSLLHQLYLRDHEIKRYSEAERLLLARWLVNECCETGIPSSRGEEEMHMFWTVLSAVSSAMEGGC